MFETVTRLDVLVRERERDAKVLFIELVLSRLKVTNNNAKYFEKQLVIT